jgi:predicted nucleic acid-binding protein
MVCLLDTGVLLRLFDRSDPEFPAIRECVRRLRQEPDRPPTTVQNLAEFWSVTTRPASARGGYGISVSLATKRIRFLRAVCEVLFPDGYSLEEWTQLIVTHNVLGVQVHDAHIAAIMQAANIKNILTLNKADFLRYPRIVPVTPVELLANWPIV